MNREALLALTANAVRVFADSLEVKVVIIVRANVDDLGPCELHSTNVDAQQAKKILVEVVTRLIADDPPDYMERIFVPKPR